MRNFLTLLFLSSLQSLQAFPDLAFQNTLPTITCPPNVTLSTGPFTCTAIHNYDVLADDDGPLLFQQTEGFPSGSNFLLGTQVNQFKVTDLDGNTATCSFTVTVKDYTPPVAICDDFTVVSIGADDPLDCYGPGGYNNQPMAFDACHFGGVTWVKATAFDNASYDNCNGIKFTIRRMPPYSNTILGLNEINGHLPCNDLFPDYPSEYERGISEQDSIKFYSSEAGTTQALVLSIYQLDADGNISIGPNGPIYNQCLIQVKLEDKLKPVCIAPPNVNTSCEQFDPSLVAFGKAQVTDNCCLDTSKVYLGQCGLTHSVNYALFDTTCNRGTLTRTFRAYDCNGNSSSCTQRVVVNYTQDYYIKFPDDTLATVCNATGVYGRPIFFGEDCELMGVSYEDEVFPIIWPDACFRIDRTWTVINWCNYNPGLPLTYVPNPNPNTSQGNAANLPGPTVSACGTPAPWAPTISKINPSDTVATDFCAFWSANANGYRYKQFVKILDSAVPTFFNCPTAPSTFLDPTENHPFYWKNVFNPALPVQNLAERKVDLSIEATDACSAENIYLRYLLFLDLDGDGIQESVVNSMNPPPADTIYYGNAASPNYIGGTPVAFDNRPVAQNKKWRFSMNESLGNGLRTAFLRWNTTEAPNTYVVPELPTGTHRIQWFAQDGCGNETVCEHTFTVLPNPLVCSPPADVVVSCEQFDPSLLAYGQATFSGGCLVQSMENTTNYSQFDTFCSKGTILRNFKAIDDCVNVSLCSQRIIVNYKQDYYIKFPNDVIVTTDCNGTSFYGEPIFFGEDCELLSSSFDDFSEPWVPDACYKFERTWSVINWCTYNPFLPLVNVSNPSPNAITNHPANLPGPTVSACGTAPPWASTIVKIYPTDPAATDFCSFWNANANGYQYKQLIKIIDSAPPGFNSCPSQSLHLDDATQNDPELWQNVFNPDLPLQDLRETPIDLSTTVTDACSGSNVNIEYLLFLDLDADGQQETVINSVMLGLAGLGWNNVLYNNLNTPGSSGGTATSFDNRPVPADQKWGFAIQESVAGNSKTASVRWNTAQAPNTFVLPELPNGRHKIKWFATDGCGNNKECEYTFSIGDTTLVGTYAPETDGFALYQNEPNPFGGSTTVRFQLPESTPATLSVFDAEGRLLYRHTTDYGQGQHVVTLEKDQLPASGVLFYKLEAGAHVAWRKMVMLR